MIGALIVCARTLCTPTDATRQRLVRFALVAATLCALGACSVPDDESVRIIDRDRVPYGLAAPATTTTTTSTTTSTTSPSTTVPLVTTPPSTLGPALPTAPPIVPDPVRLYFVVDDSIAEITRVMTAKPELLDLVSMLSSGPFPGENEYRPRTSVEFDDVTGVALRAGTLTVDVAAKFRELPAAEQRRAIAQLVLTFTNRGGVGQVTFTSEGRRFEVPRANGSFGAATVSRDDYASMLLPPLTTTTTTTTTVVSTTTTSTTSVPVPSTQAARTTRKPRVR
jgi:Sporulation and spore germination